MDEKIRNGLRAIKDYSGILTTSDLLEIKAIIDKCLQTRSFRVEGYDDQHQHYFYHGYVSELSLRDHLKDFLTKNKILNLKLEHWNSGKGNRGEIADLDQPPSSESTYWIHKDSYCNKEPE